MTKIHSEYRLSALAPLAVPATYNYIGVFLTLQCNLRCSYCINRYGALAKPTKLLSGKEWLTGLNRLQTRVDLPITLQGGEPSLHPGFYDIVNGLRPDLPLDLLTNLQFDVEIFMDKVDAERLRREAPYSSIRVSYHPENMDIVDTKTKTLRMLEKGYSVGIWSVDHPAYGREVRQAREECLAAGIDFRLKEFLGEFAGEMFGTYSYEGAVNSTKNRLVECRTSELLIGPNGDLYRCHSDLYAGRSPYGNLLDPALTIEDVFRPCRYYGFCNPCDVKTKTDRFQQFGHTSVEIKRNVRR